MHKNNRIERERKTLTTMIAMYCKRNHRDRELCASCLELQNYALKRLANCPFGEDKPTCAKCPVHCYKPEMRERVRAVMRYSGPRMIYTHPVQAINHIIDGNRKVPPKR
jgi:predicted amidophosphoribosyltransferase